MIKNGRVVGEPMVVYVGTATAIEALPNAVEGMHAYATDLHKGGYYNGATWDWGVAAIEDLTTSEINTDMRFGPDGEGGVTVYESGGETATISPALKIYLNRNYR